MKKLLVLLLFTLYSYASNPDPDLLIYQARYSFCHEKSNYRIAECLLNGNLNYTYFSGERFPKRKIDREALKKADRYGMTYKYLLRLLPQSRRYIGLRHYLDDLYAVRKVYQPPQFSGDRLEDIIRIKKIFNLSMGIGLEENRYYTKEFVEALKWYQSTHGLLVDGRLNHKTKRYLKRSIYTIISKVKKNLVLESLAHRKPSTYILVNIPEFKMHFYENSGEILTMKVIVGKRKLKTPIFHRKMQYIVLNPRWVVPDSIYKKEYAHRSKSYLRKHGFAFNSEGKLYQKAGRKNALGVVKFLFPNRFNVYMHDTPTKPLFRRKIRAFSHGCIRLEKPLALLNTLGYRYRPGKEEWIPLKQKIPVYIEYHTVWIDDRGYVQSRPDIYGYESTLFPRSVQGKRRSR